MPHNSQRKDDSGTSHVFSVRDFGATGDGVTPDTGAIQAAIDACTKTGGGTVLLPPGNYLSGTITLKDHVTLHVGASARLLGSTSLADYPNIRRDAGGMFGLEYLDYCLLNACGAHRIALTGEGIVDGQGAPPEAVNEEKGPGGNGPPVN